MHSLGCDGHRAVIALEQPTIKLLLYLLNASAKGGWADVAKGRGLVVVQCVREGDKHAQSGNIHFGVAQSEIIRCVYIILHN